MEFKNLLAEMGGLPGVNDLMDIRAHMTDTNDPYQAWCTFIFNFIIL